MYKDKLHKSLVVSENGSVPNSARTSSSYYLPDTDKTIKNIKEKVAKYLEIPIANIEQLQLLRYLKGEKYLFHYDYIPNATNQRVHTILLYLNDLKEEDGGTTDFFHYKMKVYPKTGRAVHFRNMIGDKLNTESLHAGEEIKTDVVKYAINIWTRQYPL